LRMKAPGRRGQTWRPTAVSLGASTPKISRYRWSGRRLSYWELMARMVDRALRRLAASAGQGQRCHDAHLIKLKQRPVTTGIKPAGGAHAFMPEDHHITSGCVVIVKPPSGRLHSPASALRTDNAAAPSAQ